MAQVPRRRPAALPRRRRRGRRRRRRRRPRGPPRWPGRSSRRWRRRPPVAAPRRPAGRRARRRAGSPLHPHPDPDPDPDPDPEPHPNPEVVRRSVVGTTDARTSTGRTVEVVRRTGAGAPGSLTSTGAGGPQGNGSRRGAHVSPPGSTGRGSGSTSRRPRPPRAGRRPGARRGPSGPPPWTTANTPGASPSQVPWPWQRSSSTTTRQPISAPSAGRSRRRAGPAARPSSSGRCGRSPAGWARPMSQSWRSTQKMALSCMRAKAAPTQRWRPPPKGTQLQGLSRSS